MNFNKLIILSICLLTGCNQKNEKILGYIESDYVYVASTASALIQDVYVIDGQPVKKNTALLKLDDFDYLTQEKNIKAQIEQALILFEHYEKDYEDAKILFEKKSISQNSLETSQEQYLNSKTNLILLENNLKSIQKKINDLTPTSLFDGYIDKVFYSKGEFVTLGKPLLSLYDPQKIKIKFYVPQEKIQEIYLGKNVKFKADGLNDDLSAKISFISKEIEYTPPVIFSTESRKRLVLMVEAIYQEDFILRPGQPIEVFL